MNIYDKIYDVLSNCEYAEDFFKLKGLALSKNHPMAKQLTLSNALLFYKIDVELFLKDYESYVVDKKQALDLGASEKNSALWARIPCMVQVPFETQMQKWLEENALSDLGYNVALVEFGKKWIDDLFDIARPSVLLGGGVEGMVHNEIFENEYEAPKICEYNEDFAGMEDPKGIFRLVSGIPLVLVVNEELIGERKVTSFEDLLEDEWENSICYSDDGHMLEGILLTYFYKAFGETGLKKLKKNILLGAHPSQMIKPGGIEEKPAVYIMPYIFAGIKLKEKGMRLIWPAEGAILLPLLLSVKKDAPEKEKRIAEFVCSKECGQTLVTQGKFPSSAVGVDNELSGKIWWIGWDYLYENDMLKLIDYTREIMLGGDA